MLLGSIFYYLQDDPVKQQETAQCSEFGSSTPPNLCQVDATELGMIIIMDTMHHNLIEDGSASV